MSQTKQSPENPGRFIRPETVIYYLRPCDAVVIKWPQIMRQIWGNLRKTSNDLYKNLATNTSFPTRY
jgi:hypothetical protein